MMRYIMMILSLLCTVVLCSASVCPDVVLPLWEGRDHGKDKAVISAYLPEGCGKAAVIICPGGSYFWNDAAVEGKDVALWLKARGVAAFVLSYRVAGKFNFITDFRFLYGGNCYPSMLYDAQRAVQTVRLNAERFGVDPDSVGMMGFSAGGHLAVLSAESGEKKDFYASEKALDFSSRPDFVAAVYPVVSMSDESIVHRRSRRGLMGVHCGDRNLRDALSLEKNVPADCCPVFLVHCEDDDVVDFRNSVVLDEALSLKAVPHEYHCYPCGGHGFGIGIVGGKQEICWAEAFLKWLEVIFNRGTYNIK